MAIEVTCAGCGEEYRVRDEAAGKSISCRVCGKSLQIPEADDSELALEDAAASRKKKRSANASARSKTLGPAIGLYVIGGIWFLYGLWNAAIVLSGQVPMQPPAGANEAARMGHAVGFYGAAFGIPLLTAIVLVGAFCLQTCRGYAMAIIGCVLASIPLCSPCLIFGMPFGIWGLIVLNQDDVKRAFR